MSAEKEIKFFKIDAVALRLMCGNCNDETIHSIELYFGHNKIHWSVMVKAQCLRCKTTLSKEFREL